MRLAILLVLTLTFTLILIFTVPAPASAQLAEAATFELLCKPEEGCFETRFDQPSTPQDPLPPAARARAAGAFGSGLFAQVTDASNGSLALGAHTAGPGSAGLLSAGGAGDPVLTLKAGSMSPRQGGRDFLRATNQGGTRFRILTTGDAHLAGGIRAKGRISLFANEGDNQSGTAYLEARDDSSADIALRLRTQDNGNVVEALHIRPNGEIGIGTTDSEGHRLRVQGSASVSDQMTVEGRMTHQRVTSWSSKVDLGQNLSIAPLDEDAALVVELAVGWRTGVNAGGCHHSWSVFISGTGEDVQIHGGNCVGNADTWPNAVPQVKAGSNSLVLKIPSDLTVQSGQTTQLVDATASVRALY